MKTTSQIVYAILDYLAWLGVALTGWAIQAISQGHGFSHMWNESSQTAFAIIVFGWAGGALTHYLKARGKGPTMDSANLSETSTVPPTYVAQAPPSVPLQDSTAFVGPSPWVVVERAPKDQPNNDAPVRHLSHCIPPRRIVIAPPAVP